MTNQTTEAIPGWDLFFRQGAHPSLSAPTSTKAPAGLKDGEHRGGKFALGGYNRIQVKKSVPIRSDLKMSCLSLLDL